MAVQRIRGTTLQNIRREHFSRFPLCVACAAKVPPVTRVAVELDHVIPLHKGGKDVPENRQSMCTSCHQKKSKEERGHRYIERVRIGADGWPVTVK